MARRALVATCIALAMAACERPRAFIICHNANCGGSTEPFLDDTIQALRRSLALRWNGEPLIDGVEVDAMWDPAGARCAFAHDPAQAATSFAGVDAAAEIAQHLVETAALVGDRRFFVKLELKPQAGPDGDALTGGEAEALADCVLDMYDLIAGAARETGRRVTVFFESPDPEVLWIVTQRPRYPGKHEGDDLETGLIVPIDSDPPEGLEIDVVSVKSTEIGPDRAAEFRELRSRRIDVMVWMFDADVSVLEAINEIEPRFVNTNEAVLMREWLGPPPDR